MTARGCGSTRLPVLVVKARLVAAQARPTRYRRTWQLSPGATTVAGDGSPSDMHLVGQHANGAGLARLTEAGGDRRGRLAQPRLGARQLVLGTVLP